jgi:RHS repeat-associated protein
MRMSTIKSAVALLILSLWGAAAHAGTVTYVYTDPQGTPLAEADASGNITATYDYAPYGSQAMGTAPNGPGYTGHVNDPDTGLVYMQARYYDPEVGRFLSVDPVGPSPKDVFGFNRYAYASNNPIINIDPDGRQEESVARVEEDFREAQAANRFMPQAQPISPLISEVRAAGYVTYDNDVLYPGAEAKVFNDAVNKILESEPDSNAKSASNLRRPYIRQSVRKAVADAAPRTSDGRPIDPNTLKPIDGKPDLGHKPGNEFWREKQKSQGKGDTQKQFNDRMNDPSLYQLEDPASNRSHAYEQQH